MKKIGIGLFIISMFGCTSAPLGAGAAPTVTLNEFGERLLPGEDAINKEIADLSVAVLKKEAGSAKGTMTRDVHAKAHGCVRATFKINTDVPVEYRAGVFVEPGKSYAAWLRFSNGSSKIQADKIGDARGMAIKLMGVDGKKLLAGEMNAGTQDFLMISHDAFFVKNSRDYADFFRRIAKGSNPVWFFFGRLPWRWSEFIAASQLVKKGKQMTNPLLFPYFSATSYQLGDKNVIKFSAQPCAGNTHLRNRFDDSPDYLRLNMKNSLDVKEGTAACFQFMVQRRSEPETMSVEDSRIPWDQDKSPFVPVATITVPVQEFSGEGQIRFCEELSFTPWHSLPAHRPLGNINRTRKVVYEAVSAFRHEFNHVSRREPGAAEMPD